MSKINYTKRLYSSLKKYWSPAPLIWPKPEHLAERIKHTQEYSDYCFWRENHPKDAEIDRITSDEDMLARCITMITGTIYGNWCSTFLKDEIIDGEIIQTSYNNATLNGEVTRGSHEYCQPDNVLSNYFLELKDKYVEKLYMKGGVYDYNKLDEMIPHSTCELFCRESIMLRFMQKLEALKQRGDECKITMLSLAECIPKNKN